MTGGFELQDSLRLAGALHFVQVPAMSFFRGHMLALQPELRKLSRVTQKIVYVLAVAVVLTVLGLGALVCVGAEDIARGSRLGIGLCVFLGAFWSFRACAQIWYAGAWPNGRAARFVHWAMLGLFSLQASLYWTAATMLHPSEVAPRASVVAVTTALPGLP